MYFPMNLDIEPPSLFLNVSYFSSREVMVELNPAMINSNYASRSASFTPRNSWVTMKTDETQTKRPATPI
jgi:hypothetical protein